MQAADGLSTGRPAMPSASENDPDASALVSRLQHCFGLKPASPGARDVGEQDQKRKVVAANPFYILKYKILYVSGSFAQRKWDARVGFLCRRPRRPYQLWAVPTITFDITTQLFHY